MAKIRRWVGNILIGMSGLLVVGTVCLGCFVATEVRPRKLRIFEHSFNDGAVLMREFSPCCDALSVQTMPELGRAVRELRNAMETLGPIAEFTVAATEFKVLEIQPFRAHRPAAENFRKAIPVMQNAAASMERELHRMQRLFPNDTGARLKRLEVFFEDAAAMMKWGRTMDFLFLPIVLFFGTLLSLLTFLNGYFLRNGFPAAEKKEKPL